MSEFAGFPREALDFYSGIAAHNDKQWFEEHRGDYESHVIAPAQSFITAAGERLRGSRPGVGYDPNHTGRGSFKKIHTDQRFQKGRPPFKTYAQMIFWEGPLKTKKANSAFLLHIDPRRVVVGAGLKYFEGPLLKAYRAAVAEDARGGQLGELVESLRADGYSVGDEHYKRIPRGYDADHPRADLLRFNAIWAWKELAPVPDELHDARFLDLTASQWHRLTPLHAWCVDLLNAAV